MTESASKLPESSDRVMPQPANLRASAGDTSMSLSPRSHPAPIQRRMRSPPPAPNYEDRVSFDTFRNRDTRDLSFTLVSKHKNYVHTARSRTFMYRTGRNVFPEFALEWLMTELVEDGDEIVCVRVVDKYSEINSDANLRQEKYKLEARKFLDEIQAKNDDAKGISMIVEFAVGKASEVMERMMKIYAPAFLIVGTRRSLGGIQDLLPGSVSQYCLQNFPVPVLVVRQSEMREKKMKKRLADPTRQTYRGILEESMLAGIPTLNKNGRGKVLQQSIEEASGLEAEAVRQAIGSSHKGNLCADFRMTMREEPPSPIGWLPADAPPPADKPSPQHKVLEKPGTSDREADEADDARHANEGNAADVGAARKMEAGEGTYRKPYVSDIEDGESSPTSLGPEIIDDDLYN